jgi:hypothetical protein
MYHDTQFLWYLEWPTFQEEINLHKLEPCHLDAWPLYLDFLLHKCCLGSVLANLRSVNSVFFWLGYQRNGIHVWWPWPVYQVSVWGSGLRCPKMCVIWRQASILQLWILGFIPAHTQPHPWSNGKHPSRAVSSVHSTSVGCLPCVTNTAQRSTVLRGRQTHKQSLNEGIQERYVILISDI